MLKGMGYPEEKAKKFSRMSTKDLAGQEGIEYRFYFTAGRKP